MDIRTPKERERDARNNRIRNEFVKLRKENPKASDFRLFTVLAQQHNLSWMWVRKIVSDAKI